MPTIRLQIIIFGSIGLFDMTMSPRSNCFNLLEIRSVTNRLFDFNVGSIDGPAVYNEELNLDHFQFYKKRIQLN